MHFKAICVQVYLSQFGRKPGFKRKKMLWPIFLLNPGSTVLILNSREIAISPTWIWMNISLGQNGTMDKAWRVWHGDLSEFHSRLFCKTQFFSFSFIRFVLRFSTKCLMFLLFPLLFCSYPFLSFHIDYVFIKLSTSFFFFSFRLFVVVF